VEGNLSPTQHQAVVQLGGKVQGSHITYAGNPQDLYPLLGALQPLPLVSVQRDRADLTQVFLKLVNDNQEAQP
jgi:ABC-2 type transport system ATP-binding protein